MIGMSNVAVVALHVIVEASHTDRIVMQLETEMEDLRLDGWRDVKSNSMLDAELWTPSGVIPLN